MPQIQVRTKFGKYYTSGLKVKYILECKKSAPTRKEIEKLYAMNEQQEKAEEHIWSGTGFLISKNILVTNFHVIDGANTILIKNEKIQKQILAHVVAFDKKSDLAVLAFDEKAISQPNCNFRKEVQKVETEVFVLGYPLTATVGEEVKVTTGIISSQTGYKGDSSLYQISAPIQPGNSGGPVFNQDGDIIGIICAHHTQAENANYAIKVSYLFSLLEKSGIYYNNSYYKTENIKLDLSQQIERVKPFYHTYLVANILK